MGDVRPRRSGDCGCRREKQMKLQFLSAVVAFTAVFACLQFSTQMKEGILTGTTLQGAVQVEQLHTFPA